MKRMVACLAAWSVVATLAQTAVAGGLELAKVAGRGVPAERPTIPADAVRAFTYEGTPNAVRVSDRVIAVDYGQSGVLFDRATGNVTRRYTVVDGWPWQKPEEFSAPPGWQRPPMVGPGLVYIWRTTPTTPPTPPLLTPEPSDTPGGPTTTPVTPAVRPAPQPPSVPPEVAAEVRFAGQTWRAYQPAQFVQKIQRPMYVADQPRPADPTWSAVLQDLNRQSFLEVDAGDGTTPRRFTMADGLAGNIVTDLVVCGDTLWAACVDIYNPETQEWGPGGLCRYDATTGRWQPIEKVDGRPVRWVTLMKTIGDELWIGFREGKGVAGDRIAFGMGVYPGIYRPETTAIVVARLADGKWTSYAREPLPETENLSDMPTPDTGVTPSPPGESTEHPVALGRVGDKVLLFTHRNAGQLTGNFELPMSGYVSLIDLAKGTWRTFETRKDFDAYELKDMVAEDGEVLVTSDRGLHRFDPAADRWRFLDSDSPILNPTFHTAAVVGDELWLGYARQSFGVFGEQGISRYDETTGRWSRMTPEQLGTASPVRRIVALPGGDAWVLFGDRPYMGAAARYNYYPSEQYPRPEGLGRMVDGKWEFPIPRPPAPEGPPRWMGVRDDLTAVGDRLLFARHNAVWVGPEPWKELIGDEEVVKFEPIAGQDAVEIVCRLPGDDSEVNRKYRRRIYHVVDGKPRLDERPMSENEMNSLDVYFASMGPSVIESGQYRFTLPGVEGQWICIAGGSPLGQGTLVGPAAVWFFSPGEVVRVDRKAVEVAARAVLESAPWHVTKRKQDDSVEIEVEGDTAVFSIRSPSGIGGAEITPRGTAWPTNVVVRLYLGGLESLDCSVGDPTTGGGRLHAEVQSHSGNAQLLEYAPAGGQPKPINEGSLYWCEIKTFDAQGKPTTGLPKAGGYFELTLPAAMGLPESKTTPLKITWIDFYRG